MDESQSLGYIGSFGLHVYFTGGDGAFHGQGV